MTTRFDRYFEKQMQNPEMRELIEKELASMKLGAQIARLRLKRGLNQTQLAALAGMNASKISVIEKSPRNMTVGTLIRLARALHLRVKIDLVPERPKRTVRT